MGDKIKLELMCHSPMRACLLFRSNGTDLSFYSSVRKIKISVNLRNLR
ncbi:hypothetical protein HKQ48_10300 [Bacteroides vulgatus]|uniref:Uncharacterized protein n=1 Tax=Phocaeicola vulgatus str. 3975 RP4 TaxID=1339352 RepID=A0A069SMJ5_PHOVU|nr:MULTISPECIES: hypothetical protein [Phocaeicola]KDS55958.1 hypothetical protein M099_0689 [Phocaeicola vulgatus str. 3975 RP4]MDU7568082.1 hypothetical protein [Bacteroides sp.]MBS5109561.1 hypothetical protein [Phocaeicola vulgatus]MBU8994200.1 hypothetical protein [Phocaeicola vulgatus]MBU9013329.1 hypothetical protein [Phocaeicola vulgatus]